MQHKLFICDRDSRPRDQMLMGRYQKIAGCDQMIEDVNR